MNSIQSNIDRLKDEINTYKSLIRFHAGDLEYEELANERIQRNKDIIQQLRYLEELIQKIDVVWHSAKEEGEFPESVTCMMEAVYVLEQLG